MVFYASAMAMSFSRPLLCRLTLLALPALTTPTLLAHNWTIRNPQLIGPQLTAVASSASRAVAVGRSGQIVSSSDGTSWSAQNLGNNHHLADIVYAGGRFVAVGALFDAAGVHSLALTSSDGISWTERPTDSRAWKSLVYGNGLFVAVGDHTIDTSPDGIAWTRRTPYVYAQLQGIAYGNGSFVTMGVWADDRGLSYQGVQTSRDGVSWTGVGAPTGAPLRSIAFGSGQFVMVGDNGLIFTSSDGVTWTQRNAQTAANFQDIGFVNGWFVAVGSAGTIIRSQDAVQWFHAQDSEPCELFGIGSGLGRSFAVGAGSSILASTNAQLWTSPVAATYSDLLAVAFGQQKLVAVGKQGSGLVSTDGGPWTARPVYGSLGGMPDTWFNAVTFANNSFLTIGGNGFPVFTSRDALSWTGQHSNLGVDDFFGLAYGNGRFVAAGIMSTAYGVQGGLRSSENGSNWTTRLAGLQSPLRCVVYGNGIWVAAGGDLVSSTDGITWNAKTPPVSGTFHAAAFGAGRFLIAGDVGGVITSTDGNNWSFQSAFGAAKIRGLAFGGVDFVAVGERDGRGLMWSSADGLNWTESGSVPYPLRAVTYSNGSFTAVGEHGIIVQSSPASGQLAIRRAADGSVEVSCRAEIGRQYRLQSSTTGANWNDLMSFVATASDTPYRDNAGSTRVRLYRLVSP
jgi:hypothetical protein